MNSFPRQCSHHWCPLVYIFETYICFYGVECVSQSSPLFICTVSLCRISRHNGAQLEVRLLGLRDRPRNVELWLVCELIRLERIIEPQVVRFGQHSHVRRLLHAFFCRAARGRSARCCTSTVSQRQQEQRYSFGSLGRFAQCVAELSSWVLRIEAIFSIRLEGNGQGRA